MQSIPQTLLLPGGPFSPGCRSGACTAGSTPSRLARGRARARTVPAPVQQGCREGNRSATTEKGEGWVWGVVLVLVMGVDVCGVHVGGVGGVGSDSGGGVCGTSARARGG